MKEVLVYGNTLSEAYHNALESLFDEGSTVQCQDYNTTQLECSMTVHVKNPIEEPRISKCMFGGERDLMKYLMEMIDGVTDGLVGKTESYPYTYHQRFAPYIQSCIIDELVRNPQSRRATITIRDNEKDIASVDPPCLQYMQFMIRDGKLDMFVLFRSNDLVKAFFFNAFALVRLQEIIAEQLNIPIGTYTHKSVSMHVYERDFELFSSMVHRIGEDNYYNHGFGLTYNYEDYYKDLMIEEVPEIEKMIKGLKVKYGVD